MPFVAKGGAVCRGPRPTSSFGPKRELPPARLVVHRTDILNSNVGLETLESAFEVGLASFFTQQHWLRITVELHITDARNEEAVAWGAGGGGGGALPCPPSFGLGTT